MKRELWVDYSKGIGIILVVYGHVWGNYKHSALSLVDNEFFIILNSIIYSFHMPLFFFISGIFFMSSLQRRGKKLFFYNKIETILYPYIIWSVLQGLIEVTMSNYTNGSVTFTEVFSLLWEPRMQFWFLYALFIITALSIIIYYNISSKYFIFILFIFTLFYIFQEYIANKGVMFYIVHNFVFFAMGIYFNQIKYLIIKYNKYIFPSMLILFIFIQWYFHIELNLLYTTKTYWLSLLVATISILFIVSLAMYLDTFKFHLSLLSFIGVSSLYIYVMHMLIIGMMKVFMHNILHFDYLVINLVLITVGGVLFPILIMYYIGGKMNILFYPSWIKKRKTS